MNKGEIQSLIDKYYSGDATIEEERMLFDFLTSDTSNDFQSEKAQFHYFKKSREEKPTRDLFERPNHKHSTVKIFPFGFVVRAAAILIVGVGVGYLLFLLFRSPLIETTTEANAQSEINLPDGSRVWVHGSSRVRYPVQFDKDKREVFLTGEAYFEITKDPIKPFVVHTGKTTTQVVGTSFDLRNYNGEGHVELTVFTGKVIFGSDKKVEVAHGNHVVFEKANGELHESPVKGLNALAWKTRRLQFEDTPLTEVLADLTRYFNIQFEMKTKDELTCHFTGTFDSPRPEDIMKALSFSMNIQFQLDIGIYYIDAHNCGAVQ